MDKNLFRLTKCEREIIDVMWAAEKPLSRSEIITFSPSRSWKSSSIHILLNQLLKKGAIAVDGFIKTGRNYGRTFSTAITPEEYQIMQFQQSPKYLESKSEAIIILLSSLIENGEADDETLDKLDATLQAYRNKKK